MLKLILIPIFLIITSFSQAKEYEYQQFLADNEITPLVKSDADQTVDVIEFSSFSCSHCAAFHNETLKEIKESDIYKNINSEIDSFDDILEIIDTKIISIGSNKYLALIKVNYEDTLTDPEIIDLNQSIEAKIKNVE